MMMATPETPPGANSEGNRNKFKFVAMVKPPRVRNKKLRRVERLSKLLVSDLNLFIMVSLTIPNF
jgi:hypothetical protein